MKYVTSNATKRSTALIGVISGSQSALLAAIPISAQFVITAITPIPSNTNCRQNTDYMVSEIRIVDIVGGHVYGRKAETSLSAALTSPPSHLLHFHFLSPSSSSSPLCLFPSLSFTHACSRTRKLVQLSIFSPTNKTAVYAMER